MRKMFKNIIVTLLLAFSLTAFSSGEEDFTRYRSVDISTFKEYGFKITKEFFILKSSHDVDDTLSLVSLSRMDLLVKRSLNYLPDDIQNEAYYNELLSSIARAKKNPDNDGVFVDITKKLSTYLTKTKITSITGKVEAIPASGNAPLVVTLKANVIDPEGTLIPENNYVWWVDLGGKKKILGNGPSINYTFKDEGKYGVFVDVRSNHKNKKGYTDVLSYRGKVDINVLSKVASVIVKINGEVLGTRDELKFTPEDARYGLIFDATSSVPTGKAKIIKTTWDFGNGIKRTYNRGPKVERIAYFKEGSYKVFLEMETNLGDIIKRKFTLYINDPIATINVNPIDGYLGDKFTFSAKTAANNQDLTYNWEIVDIVDDKVIFKKQAKVFTYAFPKKGYFNVRLKVNLAYAQSDDIDSKIIYISSRAPIVNFKTKVSEKNKPNKILFDATDTFDPDYTDNGKLKYSWLIDGEKIKLDKPNKEGSFGYFTFDSIGDHNVTLEVTDPDNIKGIKTSKVNISSILSVDFISNPRVITRGNSIRFNANSKEAIIYEWNFGDGTIEGGKKSSISHNFEKSGKYDVKLVVEDAQANKNSYSQTVYVGDGKNPVAVLDIFAGTTGIPPIKKGVCKGKDAYIVNRVENVQFNAGPSVDITGNKTGLDYSIKIGNGKYYRAKNISYKFDELGCFPVKLTVTSKKSRTTDSKEIWIKSENLKPILSTINVKIINPESDPVIINLSAVGAKDKDGVITSYLWYYYTDIDPDPQDFRVTTSASTKFVLPKITGNYYFVLVLTDDNGERISSEELGREASITLAGDNVNVPLATLTVNDNSVFIGEDVVFTAKVKNILGRNITSKSKYYWDFDGDGFYDQETSTNSVNYGYKKSGTFYAKLKIKHKGFSNTRLVEINVANRLDPDFKYISIGSTFIFLNTSKGAYSSMTWDLGDGTKEKGKEELKHVYNDGKSSHMVSLKLVEGSKVKTKKYKVVKNMRNLLKTKKQNFSVLSYPETKDNEIILDEELEYIYLYPSIKSSEAFLYAIDNDIEVDSDLNGGKDDDLDIKSKMNDVLKLKLNSNRVQKIAIFVKDEDDVVIDSETITITKEYIEVSSSDISKIKFLNVTDSQKEKIEYLKDQISNMPSEYRLKSMMYLQKLQEEWGDDTEKTKVILEFEGYLDETNLDNKDDLINLLEGILVDNQEDKSEKNIAYNALRNLIPNNVECSGTGTTIVNESNDFNACKNGLIEKLNAIKVSDDIELNRTLAKEILAGIVNSDKLTNDDKLNFKAILSTFVYGGVKNIPESEKKEIQEETVKQTEETSDFNIIGILKKVAYVIFGIIALLLFITGLFFIYYKISNKNDNVGFSDFILKKTKHSESTDDNSTDDFLSNVTLENNKEDNTKNDILGNIETSEVKKEEIKKVDTSGETVPDWLKGVESNVDNNMQEDKVIKKSETKKSEVKKEVKETKIVKNEPKINKKAVKNSIKKTDDSIPDWLKGTDTEVKKSKTKKEKPEIKIEDNKSESKEENKKESSLNSKKIDTDDSIPDWLKPSLPEKEDTKKSEVKKEIKTEQKETKKEKQKKESLSNVDIEKETSLDSEKSDIPDWLKPSLSEKKEIKENKEENKKSDIPDWLQNSLEKSEEKLTDDKNKVVEDKKDEEIVKKSTPKKSKVDKKEETNIKEAKKAPIKEESSKADNKKTIETKAKTKDKKTIETKAKTKDKKEVKKTSNSELWDDGMEIPDWLKSDEK